MTEGTLVTDLTVETEGTLVSDLTVETDGTVRTSFAEGTLVWKL